MLNNGKIKAIFFDQDRTLLAVQSNDVYQQCTDLAAELFSLPAAQIENKIWRLLESAGKSKEPQKHHFLPLLKTSLNQLLGEMDQEKWMQVEDKYYSLIRESVAANLGVAEFLAAEQKLLKFIFTESNQKGVDNKLRYLGLDKDFAEILTADEVGKIKPDEDYYLGILAKYNLDWQDCIFVGDKWEKDCSIPDQHGAITVLFGVQDERADYCIDDMRDLLNIIEKTNAKTAA